MFDAIERAILLREAITEFTRRASSKQLQVEQCPEDAEEASILQLYSRHMGAYDAGVIAPYITAEGTHPPQGCD